MKKKLFAFGSTFVLIGLYAPVFPAKYEFSGNSTLFVVFNYSSSSFYNQ
jgi:hypothetical protein